jgi:RING-H2 zinc finger protein RHA1
MICLLVSQSRLCMASIVFYTCIWIPFLQLKRALVTMMGFLLFSSTSRPVESFCEPAYLPAARFEDMQRCNVEEMCSICLVEFEREDVVSQLSRCRHVFHLHCIERWIERNHFTCPLCRSSLFSNVSSTSHSNCGGNIWN